MRSAIFAGLVGIVLLLTSGATSFASLANSRWANSIEALLPANAGTDKGIENDASIESISCPSTGNCSAVGSYTDTTQATHGLLLTESAGTWATGVELVLPGDAAAEPGDQLGQIVCTSAGNCTAGGVYRTSSGRELGLLVTETAGVWGAGFVLPLPANAATASDGGPGSVSCPSAGNCTAIGWYSDSSNNSQSAIWTETDGIWGAPIEAPLPANAIVGVTGAEVAELDEISCSSPGDCSAVGRYFNKSGEAEGLLLTETAGSWGKAIEVKLPANSATGGVGLYDVSCSSPGNCSAVGSYIAIGKRAGVSRSRVQGLLLTQAAGDWTRGVEVRLPADALATDPGAYLDSISCTSPGNCTAAGGYDARATDPSFDNRRLVLVTEIDGRWRKGIEPALPANAAATQGQAGEAAVSCVSPRNCAVVGSYSPDHGDNMQGLLLFQRDGVWARGAEAVLPANAHTGHVWGTWNAVSCVSIADCVAAGTYADKWGSTQGLLAAGSIRPSFMPNLVGKTLHRATRAIASHGCSLDRVTYVTSTSVPKGRVISQTPEPGTRLTLVVKIRLVVSAGLP